MKREEAIDAVMSTGKTREQAEAFLNILGSAFTRRGWVGGEPLSEEAIGANLDVFIGRAVVAALREQAERWVQHHEICGDALIALLDDFLAAAVPTKPTGGQR